MLHKVTKNLKCDIKSKFLGNVNTLDEESPHPGISIVLERINSKDNFKKWRSMTFENGTFDIRPNKGSYNVAYFGDNDIQPMDESGETGIKRNAGDMTEIGPSSSTELPRRQPLRIVSSMSPRRFQQEQESPEKPEKKLKKIKYENFSRHFRG